MEDVFELAGTKSTVRGSIVGTGKYKDFAETQEAIEVSGAEIVTVAVRRVNITDRNKENLLDYLRPEEVHDPAQHRRLLHRRRRRAHLPAGARSGRRQDWSNSK